MANRETILMTRITTAVGLALCVALAAASLASAGGAVREPAVFASAELGNFEIISGVLVENKTVDQRGVWLDDTAACSKRRVLRVRATLFYAPASGPTKRVVRNRRGRVANCSEGGPNLGFTLRAKRYGLACADGAWLPGTYSFITRTTHRGTRLRAVASLTWEKTGTC